MAHQTASLPSPHYVPFLNQSEEDIFPMIGTRCHISSYQAIETQKAANNRPGPPFLHTSLEDWHFRMAKDYCAAADPKEAILAVMVKLLATLGMVAVLGRVIDWRFRRSVVHNAEPQPEFTSVTGC
jgi:hypothetical protein